MLSWIDSFDYLTSVLSTTKRYEKSRIERFYGSRRKSGMESWFTNYQIILLCRSTEADRSECLPDWLGFPLGHLGSLDRNRVRDQQFLNKRAFGNCCCNTRSCDCKACGGRGNPPSFWNHFLQVEWNCFLRVGLVPQTS